MMTGLPAVVVGIVGPVNTTTLRCVVSAGPSVLRLFVVVVEGRDLTARKGNIVELGVCPRVSVRPSNSLRRGLLCRGLRARTTGGLSLLA